MTPSGTATCRLPDGRTIEVPVVQGILEHLSAEGLARLLADPAVLRKCTVGALRVAPWPVLHRFPPQWPREWPPLAKLREGRLRALELLLPPADGWILVPDQRPQSRG